VVAQPVLHLPQGEPVKLLLRSVDVLHNFTVPQFRAKMDFVPGMVTFLWLTPTRAGSFDLLCEELCGVGHFAMRGSVVVEERAAFDSWLGAQRTFAQTLADGAGDALAGAANYAVCAACHGAQGEGNAAMHAPRLAGQEAWYLRRQLDHFKGGLRGAHEQDTWGRTMAPMAATLADDTAVRNVVAHILTFPAASPPATAAGGDAGSGQRLYQTTCSTCHGDDGRGRRSVNAPNLVGLDDWYLITQLHNFREGIRGRHPQDMYGLQMALMSATLADEAAVSDMAAYINQL
jgi:cytochrome c oxidase subunit II